MYWGQFLTGYLPDVAVPKNTRIYVDKIIIFIIIIKIKDYGRLTDILTTLGGFLSSVF